MSRFYVDANIAKAKTISTKFYTDPDYFEEQKGIRSRFYKHGRYSVKKEPGTHHFHRLIADCMM